MTKNCLLFLAADSKHELQPIDKFWSWLHYFEGCSGKNAVYLSRVLNLKTFYSKHLFFKKHFVGHTTNAHKQQMACWFHFNNLSFELMRSRHASKLWTHSCHHFRFLSKFWIIMLCVFWNDAVEYISCHCLRHHCHVSRNYCILKQWNKVDLLV